MEQSYRPPNILHLSGITMEDYQSMEDIFDQQILDSVSNKPNVITEKYDIIPKVFTSIKHWPRKTNLKCWMCDFLFEDVPKFIPTYIKDNSSNFNTVGDIEVGVLGNMCSFPCASLYINTYFPRREEAWKLQDNLSIVYKLFTGTAVHYIPEAPHKTCMEVYGGHIKEVDFRKKIQDIEKSLENKLAMRYN